MSFWIIAIALTVTIGMFLARAFLSGGSGKEHPAVYDLAVYRDQLKDVERDVARNILSEADAERLRIEISRKVLAADAQLAAAEAGESPRGPVSVAIIAVVSAFLLAGGIGGYLWLGQPGYPDMSLAARIELAEEARASRLSQAEYEAELPARPINSGGTEQTIQLIEELRRVVSERPEDQQGLRLLASNEASLGNYSAAHTAQAALVALLGAEATPLEFVTLADYLILAANGYVSPEAETALANALRLQPENPVGRYYMALMMAQTGRPDVTFRVWRTLLDEGPANAPWIGPIRAQMPEIAAWAGVDYQLPPETENGGPTAEDIAAAADLSEEDRAAMIEAMVAQLSDRLAAEGGSAQDWARLISSLGVLGQIEDASAIWNEAQIVFAADPSGLAIVRAAAQQAGVAQ